MLRLAGGVSKLTNINEMGWASEVRESHLVLGFKCLVSDRLTDAFMPHIRWLFATQKKKK